MRGLNRAPITSYTRSEGRQGESEAMTRMGSRHLRSRIGVCVVLCLVVAASACRAALPFGGATPTPTAPVRSETALSWNDVEARLRPATVLVQFTLPGGTTYATTGVTYAPGLVLTVVPPLDQGPPEGLHVRLPDESTFRPAELLGASPCDGVAVVRAEGAGAGAPLETARTPDIGEDVLVYGYSAGNLDAPAVSLPAALTGPLTDPRRNVDRLGVTVDLSGLTAGALLADRYGAVLGLSLPNGLFVPAERAQEVATLLAEGRGLLWLGLGLSPHRNPERYGTERGLVVLHVSTNGPAAQAGIEPGMLLTHLDDTEIESFAQVCDLLRQHRQGDELRVQLRQPTATHIQLLETRIALGERRSATPIERGREPYPQQAHTPRTRSWSFDRPEDSRDWPTGSSELGTGEVRDGSYTITLTQPNAFGVFEPLSLPLGTDQRIAATVSLPEEAGVGLLVRSTQEADGSRNLYLCAVVRTAGQLVATCSLAIAGQPAVLLPVTPLTGVDPAGDPLELELSAQGDRLRFRVAGQTVADLEDPLLGHGRVGLWVESFESVPLTVRFHDVRVELVPR